MKTVHMLLIILLLILGLSLTTSAATVKPPMPLPQSSKGWSPEQTATLRQEISDQGYRCDTVQELNLSSYSARGATFQVVCDQGRAFRLIYIDKQPRLIRPW